MNEFETRSSPSSSSDEMFLPALYISSSVLRISIILFRLIGKKSLASKLSSNAVISLNHGLISSDILPLTKFLNQVLAFKPGFSS